jgi:hypothetical protein
LSCFAVFALVTARYVSGVAGKLGKAAIPPPTDIGPPLQLPGELSSSSSSSMDGDAECIPYVTGAGLSSNSHLKTVDEVEGGVAAAAAAVEEVQGGVETSSAAVGRSSSSSEDAPPVAAAGSECGLARNHSRIGVSEQGPSAGAASASTRTSDSSDGGSSVRIVPEQDSWQDVATTASAETASPQHRQRQQQQQKASSGWWGFLRKQQPAAAAAAHVDQLATDQQQQQAAESAEAAAERLAQQAEAVYGER